MAAARALGPKLYRRLGLTAGSGLLCLGLLAGQMQAIDPVRVLGALGQVGWLPWVLAACATLISFCAVAGYDLALHRHLATGISPGRARSAGFAAIAIGQTVGMGVVAGTLVRWRLLPELGFLGAARLSLLVAGSFLVAWAVLTVLVLVTVPGAPYSGVAIWGLVAVAVLLCGLAFPRPGMPNLITGARLIFLAAIDCGAAALALWLLVPADIGLAAFLPAFLLAFGAGLLSGSPAGLGAFELVLLALLPAAPPEALVAGVLAWRGLYYALPALAGAGVALLCHGDAGLTLPSLAAPEIAEAGLGAQGTLRPHAAGFLAGRTPHGLVALAAVADLDRFQAAAQEEGRFPVLYKADARTAARARAAGLAVLPVACEAWLCPQDFGLDGPVRAGLRRKLRRAAATGVVAARAAEPDWTALAAVNTAWTAAHGGEYGFSMGRFDPAYCAGQQAIVASQAGRTVGFATFHAARVAGQVVWTLDLLRPAPDAPEGTAQLLVVAGIEAARAAGARILSLAAVPIGGWPDAADPVARLGRRLARDTMPGLMQFKAGFAPNWRRLYIAGPSWLALALVGWEIWRAVQRPAGRAEMRPTTTRLADNEIASGCNPWQREGDRPA